MFFQVGQLYKCSKYFLLIYPSKKAANRGWTSAGASVGSTAGMAYWSKKLNCQVRFSEPNETFMLLKQEDMFLNVLFGEKQGWIINEDWLEIKHVKVPKTSRKARSRISVRRGT
jgi:hypothetical protein